MTEKMPYFTPTRGLLFLHAEKEILSLSATWIRPEDTAAQKDKCCLVSVCGGRKWLFLCKSRLEEQLAEAGKGRAGEETGGGWLMTMTLELRASSLVQ